MNYGKMNIGTNKQARAQGTKEQHSSLNAYFGPGIGRNSEIYFNDRQVTHKEIVCIDML